MSSPQEGGTQVSTASVLDVQRQKIHQLTEENIMLMAALADKERQLAALQREE